MPVPLPFKSPERVVEPVPPYPAPMVEDARSHLLLNVFQLAMEIQPAADAEAVVQSMASAPPTAALLAVTVIPLVPETVPVATLCNPLASFPYMSWPEVKVICPVPPLATGRMPVTSAARSTDVPRVVSSDPPFI